MSEVEEQKASSLGEKSEARSSPVRITKTSKDLNRYVVDKFHLSTAKSKNAPFESIDLFTSLLTHASPFQPQEIVFYFGSQRRNIASMELPQTQQTKHKKNKTVLVQGQMLQRGESSCTERNSKNGADSSSQRCLTLLRIILKG